MIPITKSNFKAAITRLHASNQGVSESDLFQKLTAMKQKIWLSGDAAVLEFTRQFDRINQDEFKFKVTLSEIKKAAGRVDKKFLNALKAAKQNIVQFHKNQKPKDWTNKDRLGNYVGMRYSAIESVGLYVPGGRAVYPSTVLMNAIPAIIAGVKRIVIVTPPQPDGSVSPLILAAASVCNITEIYKVGGAQAVFAIACGTKSIPKVDKIVGPGNVYVTAAKQMVYGTVDIDKPAAGPSEVLIYVNQPEYGRFSAADMLAQLEHDPLSNAVVVSENESTLQEIQRQLKRLFQTCARKEIIEQSLKNSLLLLTKNESESISLINEIASEHLELMMDHPQQILKKIRHAGSIFVGPYSPVPIGDYFAGPNHVLPTSGTARFASPLNVMDFMKFSSILSYTKQHLKRAYPHIRTLALQEKLDAHEQAIRVRLDS